MNLLLRVLKYIFDADCRFRVNASQGLYKSMDDKMFLQRYYKARTGRELELDNPKTFQEKLQWIKLNDRKDIYHQMVDKYEKILYNIL